MLNERRTERQDLAGVAASESGVSNRIGDRYTILPRVNSKSTRRESTYNMLFLEGVLCHLRLRARTELNIPQSLL